MEISKEEIGVYYLCGEITLENCAEAVAYINTCNDEGYSAVHMHIMSEGGVLNGAFAVVDAIEKSKIPVHTIGTGVVASSALLILFSGTPGYRIATKNCLLVSHQFSVDTSGKYFEFSGKKKYFDQLNKQLMRQYMKCTKLSKRDIEKILLPSEDVFLSAKEAKKYNLIDTIR